jgi:uncharacterized protein (TIGR04255 family)
VGDNSFTFYKRPIILSNYPTLTKAPITEALLDIRVKLSPNFDVKKIDSIYQEIKDLYPKKKEQRLSEFHFERKPGAESIKSMTAINGFRYLSDDEKRIFQARLDGFTFNRLSLYTKWEDLRKEAYNLWLLYKKITSPEVITRVALRYINNLKIPMPMKEFGDYLKAPPTVPEALPQGVTSFLTRINIYDPGLDANAIITQALEPAGAEPASLAVVLDIDVFRIQSKGIDEEEAWNLLDKLRHFKNKIFFESITDKLLEVYK